MMDDGMILLWGLSGDDPFDCIAAELQRRGAGHVVVDQRNLHCVSIEAADGDPGSGLLRTPEIEVRLESITAAYLRVYDVRTLLSMNSAEEGNGGLEHALRTERTLSSWCEQGTALVVNPPTAMSTNNSKPYQAMRIREFFRVPSTLITTDREAAEDFCARFDAAIYKSVSGVRSIVERLKPEHRERFADLRWCPTQFQEYVPGVDYRVHVVGSDTFACRIETDADDYRYAGKQGARRTITPCTIPESIAGRAVAVSAALGLHLAGVDLRCTPDGDWFCFEVNPSPEFAFYASWTDQPIGDALATMLLDPPNAVHERNVIGQ
ncbi:MAG TPA: RimK domain-containing protein ATP-grasp [Candidatus Kapabacteria bacterium]|nr:RimK domain-containing protein ATP-grasp [Candidatus Kapabacteria bacterium]